MEEEYYKKYDGLWGESLSRMKERLVYRRNTNTLCIYCGNVADTREHCPPKSFLKQPYPLNLKELPACYKCNNGFSEDEEFTLAYLDVLYKILHQEEINTSDGVLEEANKTIKNHELNRRICRIIKKVALGHAVYQLSDGFGDMDRVPCLTLFTCRKWENDDVWNALLSPVEIKVIPELGSRSDDNIFVVIGNSVLGAYTDWIEVQPNVYSYMAWIDDDSLKVRMLIKNYFVFEVTFQ